MAEINRVQTSPDGHWLAYTGDLKSSQLLSWVPGAKRDRGYLFLPANRTSFLAVETLGRLAEADEGYAGARAVAMPFPSGYAELYPKPTPGQPEPFPHQVEAFCLALKAIEEGYRGFGNYSTMGTGKGHPIGTLILAPSGWKKIEDLVVGDEIIGSQGCPVKVTGVFVRGTLPLYRVTMNDGTSVKVDSDHLWAVQSANARYRKRGYETLSTEQVKDRIGTYLHIPMVQPVQFNKQEAPALDPYLIGVLLGDGYFGETGVSFTPGDLLVVEEVRKLLPDGMKLSPCGKGTSKAWYIVNDCNTGANHNSVTGHVRDMGLKRCRSWEKFIPQLYLMRPPVDRLALIQGLMDTDGTIDQTGGTEFDTSSEQLAKDFIFLVESLGGTARLRVRTDVFFTYKGQRKKGRDCYRIHLCLPQGMNPFRVRSDKFRPRTKYKATRIIRSIEPEGEGQVICISVDAPDQLYVTERFIVTHNTRWAIDLMRLLSAGPRSSRVCLVVVYNSTALQWVSNLKAHWPEAEVVPIVGRPLVERRVLTQHLTSRRQGSFPAQVLVVNWESVSPLLKDLSRLQFDVIVADEAHRLRNRVTKMAKAVCKLGQKADFRIAMTGTPIGNAPDGFFGIYKFLDPRLFGTDYWKFTQRYFRLGGFTGNEPVELEPSSAVEFIERVYRCAYRVTKAALKDLPPALHETVRLPMRPKQRELYDLLKKDLCATLATEEGEKLTISVENALVLTMRLQQITAGVVPIADPEEKVSVAFPSAKTDWLVDYVVDAVREKEEQILIWAKFTTEIATIHQRLLQAGLPSESVGRIEGKVKTADREALRQRFNDRSDPIRVLILQIQAAAYGLDVPGTDTAIYHSLTFSYLDRTQSKDRGHRIGRVGPYRIIDLVCTDSVDAKIEKAIEKHQAFSDLLLVEGLGEFAVRK